jgi:hypothetical protein
MGQLKRYLALKKNLLELFSMKLLVFGSNSVLSSIAFSVSVLGYQTATIPGSPWSQCVNWLVSS